VCCCLEMFDPPSKEPYSIPEYAFTKALWENAIFAHFGMRAETSIKMKKEQMVAI
jgi:hypothetical protein